MTLTTAAAFDEFKRKLQLTADQKTTVNRRRDSVDGYIRQAFPSTSTLEIDTTKLIGSAGRDTIIRPLDDIDVLAVFRNKDAIFENTDMTPSHSCIGSAMGWRNIRR